MEGSCPLSEFDLSENVLGTHITFYIFNEIISVWRRKNYNNRFPVFKSCFHQDNLKHQICFNKPHMKNNLSRDIDKGICWTGADHGYAEYSRMLSFYIRTKQWIIPILNKNFLSAYCNEFFLCQMTTSKKNEILLWTVVIE